jgi:hypothetical protein
MLNFYFFLIEYVLYLDIIRSIFVIFLDYSSGYESSSGSSDNETQASIKQTLSLSQLDKIWGGCILVFHLLLGCMLVLLFPNFVELGEA